MGCADSKGYMVHRKQAVDVVGLIAQLAGSIVLISLFFPAVRRGLAGLGLIAVYLSILVVMSLIGFSVYRLATRQGAAQTENPFATSGDGPDQTEDAGESEIGNDNESETAPDLLEPALRRRYPWRHEIADQP
ncbi:MAG: hypothetical protein WAO02_17260 [Verrucomicrobiia bacterium]